MSEYHSHKERKSKQGSDEERIVAASAKGSSASCISEVRLQEERLRTIEDKVDELLKRITPTYAETAIAESTEKGVDRNLPKVKE